MLTLALVWQLMEKYTLSLLAKLSPDGSPIGESEIIDWANQRLQDSNKETSIKHFQVLTFIFFLINCSHKTIQTLNITLDRK